MMHGAVIEGKDTLRTWGFALMDEVRISSPEQKTAWVNIPAADGAVDISTALTDGVPVFGNRTVAFSLVYLPEDGGNDGFQRAVEELTGMCGKRVKVGFPWDARHHFLGTFAISEWNVRTGLWTVGITLNADPYRYMNAVTKQTVVIGGGASTKASFVNEQKTVRPKFHNVSSHNITVYDKDNNSWTLHPDDYEELTGLTFGPGIHFLRFAGTSGDRLTVEYQEARL